MTMSKEQLFDIIIENLMDSCVLVSTVNPKTNDDKFVRDFVKQMLEHCLKHIYKLKDIC